MEGGLQGGLKRSRECLDCCHGGKDAAIKLSSEVRHRLAGRGRAPARARSGDHHFHRCVTFV